MIEVQFVGCATRHALSTIACPHLKFYACWNNATTFNKTIGIFFRGRFVRHTFHCDEFKFENVSSAVVLNPRIYKVKESIVSPNTGFDFFIDLNNVRALFTCLELLCSLMEFSVLGKRATRLPLWLVERFWVRNALTFRLIMPFVNKHSPVVLHLVSIRGIWANRHEDDRVMSLQTEIHAPL